MSSHYQTIFETLPVGIFQSTLDGRFLDANAACLQTLGFPDRATLLATPVTEVYAHPEERQRLMTILERDGLVRNLVVEMRRPNGSRLWARIHSRLIRGEIEYIEGVVEDITDEKELDETHRDSEALYRQMFENHRAVKLLINPQTGGIVDVNRAACDFYGYSRAELRAMRVFNLSTHSLERTQEEMMLAVAQVRGYFLSQHRLASGAVREVEVYSGPLEVGGQRLLFSIVHDITERRRTEADLRAAETRFRTLVEQLPAITYTFTYGDVHATTYISPQVETLLGFTPAEWLTDPDLWLRQVHSGDRERVLLALHQRDTEGRPFNMEYRVLTRDGRSLWFHNQNTVMFNALDEPLFIYGVMFDVTELKQRERELEAIVTMANALRAASTRAEMVPIVLNQLQSLLNAGGAVLTLRDPMTSETVVELGLGGRAALTGLRVPSGEGHWGRVIATGDVYINDDARADLPPLWVGHLISVACVPLIVHAQIIGALEASCTLPFSPSEVRLLTIIADMIATALQSLILHEQTRQHAVDLEQRVAERTAELRAANEHLQTLSRLKDEFVSNVSHELRTPITSLKLYHDLLTSRPDKRDDYLGRLKRETNRLERLVEDVLRLSRMDRGQVTATLAPVDLNALVALIVTDRQPMAESHGLSLSFSEQRDLPRIQADQGMLGQALSILLTNALTYTPAGGQIRVRTLESRTADEQFAGFSVADTGPGISPDEQAHMFQRFYRGVVGRQSGVPGTGLGLAIVREIVERHHGRADVVSTGLPGQGATFTVWLPV